MEYPSGDSQHPGEDEVHKQHTAYIGLHPPGSIEASGTQTANPKGDKYRRATSKRQRRQEFLAQSGFQPAKSMYLQGVEELEAAEGESSTRYTGQLRRTFEAPDAYIEEKPPVGKRRTRTELQDIESRTAKLHTKELDEIHGDSKPPSHLLSGDEVQSAKEKGAVAGSRTEEVSTAKIAGALQAQEASSSKPIKAPSSQTRSTFVTQDAESPDVKAAAARWQALAQSQAGVRSHSNATELPSTTYPRLTSPDDESPEVKAAAAKWQSFAQSQAPPFKVSFSTPQPSTPYPRTRSRPQHRHIL